MDMSLPALSNMMAMWLLNLSSLKFIEIKTQSLSLTSQISNPQGWHVASGYHIG